MRRVMSCCHNRGPGMRRPRYLSALLLAGLLMFLSLQAAAMRRIDPGEDPKLAPDEGLVVLSVDASSKVSSVHVGHAGGGTAEVLNFMDVGRNLRLYATKAGEYQWDQIMLENWAYRSRFDLDSDEYRFKVTPGRISYPGDLILRVKSWTNASVHIANRSLPVIDWLESQHAALYQRLPFGYSGLYPDPFPEYYRTVRVAKKEPADKLNGGREPPKPGDLPLPAALMWKPNYVSDIALNPSGDLLAESVHDDNGNWGLNLIDLKAGFAQRVETTAQAMTGLVWKDDRKLIVDGGDEDRGYTVFDIGDIAGKKRSITSRPIAGNGRIVDLLPADPDHILFEGFDSRSKLAVHRIELAGSRSITSFQTAKIRDRLNVGVSEDRAWYADGHGRLRAAILFRDETYVLVHGRDGVYKEVLEYKGDGGFDLAGLSFDGEVLYGFTDDDRDQRDLVAFDPATRKVARTVFSKPGTDIASVIFNDRREPVAVRYYQSGRLVTEYFDDANRNLDRMLQAAFPGRAVAVVDRSRDGRQLILWVDGSDHPPQLYHLDLAKKAASLLEDIAPWLTDRTFAPVHVLNVKSSDGLAVEAFLTLPAGSGKRPLLVFPHGGPIGVSDRLHFNRDVQFLASQGYAVLQVNFRGSEGYGKVFREAGHRNYGRLIEDDIDAALRVALANHPLDETRMCTLGASYGGYSALVSAIRWPGRFRCAVSMSGVSDRVLVFTASDGARSVTARPVLERLMGNPHKDLAAMQETSPLYHADKLTLPLMLVHGREDVRVDFEHTRRLVRMLNLEGRPPVLLTFPKMGHGIDDPVLLDTIWTGIAGFLQQHLGSTTTSAPAASASTQAAGTGAVQGGAR